MSPNAVRFGVLFLGVMLMGCGRGETPRTDAGSTNHDPARARGSDRSGMELATRARPLQPGAAGAVETTLEAFRTSRLEVVYDALPASFQQDITQLVHEFADRVDPALWDMTTQLLRKAINVFRQQDEIFIALLTRPGSGTSTEITIAWAEFVNAAERLVDGPLTNQEKWKSLDIHEALRTDISRVVRRLMTLSALANPPEQNPLQQIDLVQVDLVESFDVSAQVRIIPHGGTDAVPTTPFVLQEGKWIPRSLAEEWPTMIDIARKSLAQWETTRGEPSVKHLQEKLRVIDRVLDQMLTATNAEQLGSAATPIVLQITQWSDPIKTPPAPLPEGPPEGVTILIARELTDEELTRLLRILEPLTDDPDQEYHLATANGGKTFISIKPVKEIAAFAAKLDFITDPKVDALARTITAHDARVP